MTRQDEDRINALAASISAERTGEMPPTPAPREAVAWPSSIALGEGHAQLREGMLLIECACGDIHLQLSPAETARLLSWLDHRPRA